MKLFISIYLFLKQTNINENKSDPLDILKEVTGSLLNLGLIPLWS